MLKVQGWGQPWGAGEGREGHRRQVVSFWIAYSNSKMYINFHSHQVELATAPREASSKTFLCLCVFVDTWRLGRLALKGTVI